VKKFNYIFLFLGYFLLFQTLLWFSFSDSKTDLSNVVDYNTCIVQCKCNNDLTPLSLADSGNRVRKVSYDFKQLNFRKSTFRTSFGTTEDRFESFFNSVVDSYCNFSKRVVFMFSLKTFSQNSLQIFYCNWRI
jgi:hypothetical protein